MLLEIKTFTDTTNNFSKFCSHCAQQVNSPHFAPEARANEPASMYVGTLRSGLTACEPSSHVLHAQTLHVLQHSTCLRATCLSEELFAAAAMQAVQKDLMAMKVAELKEELEARGEAKTGCKAWLRRRLHAAIVRMHLEARDAEDGL